MKICGPIIKRLIGFSGIVILFSDNLLIDENNFTSALLILLGSTCYVIGGVLTLKISKKKNENVTSSILIWAVIILIPVVCFIEQPWNITPRLDSTISVIYLGLVSTGIAWLLRFKILKTNGNKVMFAASDTFRAAAIEQLENWANKIDVKITKSSQGSDPASVAYKAVEEAIKNNFHQVLIDTAGRLQNKKNLMEEYKKIANVTKKIDQDAPHNIILVLDATSGQNVINQVEEFNKIIPLTGLIMTKLDGTAKGGILLAIAKKYQLPIIALGLGEKEDDLQLFNAEKFAEAFTQVN